MSFFDTISRIIQQGKEMAVKATPSSTVTYNKVTPVDNSKFQSNPLLQTRSQQTASQPTVFGVPNKGPVIKPLAPKTANTTGQLVTPTKLSAPAIPPPPINPLDIIRRGKEQAIRQGTTDPSALQNQPIAKIPVIGKLLAGTGENNRGLYAPDTLAGSIERQGAVGFLMQGFKNLTNPDRKRIGEQIYSDYETRIKAGEDPETALKVATQNLVNKKTGNLTGVKRSIDDIQNPNIELTTEQALSLMPKNLGRKVMAVLDAPGIGATTKPVKGALQKFAQKTASNMTEADAKLLRNMYVARTSAPDVINEQRMAEALNLDKLPYDEQKQVVKEVLKEYDARWAGVDEVANPPVVPNRPGAMDVKKPNVLDKTVLAKTNNVSDPTKYKSAEEFVKAQGRTVYHGTNKENAKMLRENPRLLTPDEQNQFPTTVVGDTQIGVSTSQQKDIADYFASLQPTGKGEVVEFVLPNNAKIYRLPDGDEIDNLGLAELQRLKSEGFDAIEDVSNAGGEAEIRVLSPEKLKTKAQLTDIYNKANAKQKPNKMSDYRAGKPNSEGGYIQNPLAGKGETPKSNNQVVSSGNDSIKPKSAPVSYETKLQQRVDLLRQVPNKNARVQRELAKKSWKLSDLMTKKAARNEKLSEVRDTKIVDRGVKDRIKLASSAGETRSLSKLAEEQGLYETQQRNLTPEMLEKRRFEIQMEQEALDADPVSELSQFVARRGEFKGTLPEHATTKSGFGLDERVTGAGFDSTEEARQAYDLYKQRKANLLEKKKILADDIRIARNEKNTEQSFARKVSPIESLTKRVATNASKITKRVEQKVAARQVQFEKREARRQVIKAKAELIDKMRKSSSEITAVKSDIVEYAKNNLPTSQVGKFISVVKNATNRRQAVQAFNRIDNLVTEIEKKTLIRDIQKSVANLPASVEIGYATKIKELVSDINLKGYSKATVQKLEETQKFLIEQKKLGKDVELPSRLLEKLKILGRTDAKNLTVSQLQGIQDEIELLKHLGKTKQRIKTNLYEAEKAYIAEDLISTAKPLSYKEIKTTPGVAQTLGIKTANKVKQVLNRLKKARMSIRPIDGLAEATGMEQVKNRIDLSYSNYLDKLDNFAKQREEIVDRLKLKDTNMERIGIYAAKQQDGGYEKLANLGITEEAADAIKLTDAEQEYYEFGRKMFDEDFDEVKAYMQDVYNKDVGKVDNYVSFQTDFNAMSELEIYDRFGTLADDAVTRTKTVKKDFTESRTGSGGQKIKLNFDSILIRHKDNVSYMLNLGKDIKMYSEVLNDPTLRTKLGDLGTFAWKEYMSLMARKGGVDSQKQIATIDMLRRNLGVGVMAYKLSTALVQVSSLADAAATIGSKWVSIGVYDIASNREARKFIIDNFPEIREMIGDDIAFLELGDDWLGKVQQAGFIPLRKLDALMRSTSAVAAYKKLASDAGITVDFAKPNKDLIQKATKLVRQSQGSSSFKDSPLALTTGSFTGNVSVDKAIFQFQSFMLNRWENIERQIWREGFGSGNYVKGFTAVFWMVVAAGIIEESSRRVSRGAINLITGEDKEEDPFIETVIGNTTKNVPIAGNIMNSLAYDSNPVPFINAAETTLGGYKRAFTGVETATKAKGAVDATLGTANLLFGIPGTVQAGQLIKPFIGERDGSGNKELDETIKDSKEKEKNRSKDAEAMLVSLKSLPPDRANAVMKELKINDEAMFNKVKALKQAEDLNWSKEEKAIANLGVTDGTKARYVYSQVNKLGTAEEKNAYLKELFDRKIISKEVLKQIKDLKEGGKNNATIE